ncbi:hypothetical protein BKA80DRAFT_265123 [Phyllosticta citrichinensis]
MSNGWRWIGSLPALFWHRTRWGAERPSSDPSILVPISSMTFHSLPEKSCKTLPRIVNTKIKMATATCKTSYL